MGLQAAASATLGAASKTYATTHVRDGFAARNPAQRLGLRFGTGGVRVRSARATLGLALEAIGTGAFLRAVGSVSPSARSNRVTYVHPGLTEWFANGPLGLEQGFSVERAPVRGGDGALTLVLGLSGNLRASVLDGRRSLALGGAHGVSLRYSGLVATDASGHRLGAWLELRGRRLLLRVDARRARYPVVIDPFVQQGNSLTGSGEWVGSNFGESVALSANGSTALIGGPSEDSRVGAAWVFTRTGSTWTQQEKLTGGGERGAGQFGTAVALSADGNTALIGGIGDDKDTGAAWVFTRSGSTWSQQGEKLVGSSPEYEGRFGESVALSGEGTTALIGCGPFYGHGGGAWVFTRTGSTWSQQGPRINPSGEIGEGNFGTSVALSFNGSTALIGAPRDDANAGAAWVYTRSGEDWAQQGGKLTGAEEAVAFASNVALSGEGSTALISESQGARVFVLSGSTWTQQGSKLGDGGSVALSGSGDTALIGGQGAVFERSGSTWTEQQSSLFVGEGPEREREYGYSVALSEDGTTALIGAPDATVVNDGSAGRVYTYTSLPQTPRIVPAAVSSVTPSSATLNAKVNPNGYNVSKCEFEYGHSLTYEHSVPCSTLPGAGESLVTVSAAISGLSEETTYHFRVVATNSVGTTDGEDETFQTLPTVPSFTWSGSTETGPEDAFDWSLGKNWLGAEAPTSGEAIRALTFPHLGWECEEERNRYYACYDSKNDESGLNAESVRLDNANDYVIAGEGISIGRGGLAVMPASGQVGAAGDVIAAPLELSASQTWKISGRGSIGEEEAGLLLAGNVRGGDDALGIELSEEPVVYFAENHVEAGPVSIEGANRGTFGVLNGVVALLEGQVNAGDGQPLNLSHVFVTGSGGVGKLETEGVELQVGDPANGIEATSVTLDPASDVGFSIVGAGSTAKTEYSQLVSKGAVALADANVEVVVRPPKAGAPCPVLERGQTYTFVSSTGGLSGAFADAPAGGAELPVRYAETCAPKSQTLRIAYHESGAVQTVTGTVEEGSLVAEEEAIARLKAEAEATEHGYLEAAFLGRLAEEEAAAKHRKEEADTTVTGAASGPRELAAGAIAIVPEARLAARGLFAGPAGTLVLKVSCPAGEARCVGRLILRAAGAVGAPRSGAAKSSATPETLASGQFSVAGGRTSAVVLRLAPRARQLLKSRTLLHARLTLVEHEHAGAWHTSVVAVTIHAGRLG